MKLDEYAEISMAIKNLDECKLKIFDDVQVFIDAGANVDMTVQLFKTTLQDPASHAALLLEGWIREAYDIAKKGKA